MASMHIEARGEIRSEDAAAVKQVVDAGGVIVLPTDTVYGIGADPYSTEAVNAVLAAKGRGRQMPPPVLIADPADAAKVAAHLTPAANALIEAFWPGALTLIVKAAEGIRFDLGDIKDTVAIRMPDHPVTLSVLRETGPLAVTSANLTGQPPAIDAEQAVGYFGEDVACYIDSGPTPGPVPSTIVDVTGEEPVLLREGVLSVADLERACGQKVLTNK
ncbi:MAG: L-threonylcarbamoyladenylate synthase [Actinomycetaceae bacterium]|nr:L-threonylcarbamoyladenylate synthase [Actinomycetaceae bacterium]